MRNLFAIVGIFVTFSGVAGAGPNHGQDPAGPAAPRPGQAVPTTKATEFASLEKAFATVGEKLPFDEVANKILDGRCVGRDRAGAFAEFPGCAGTIELKQGPGSEQFLYFRNGNVVAANMAQRYPDLAKTMTDPKDYRTWIARGQQQKIHGAIREFYEKNETARATDLMKLSPESRSDRQYPFAIAEPGPPQATRSVTIKRVKVGSLFEIVLHYERRVKGPDGWQVDEEAYCY